MVGKGVLTVTPKLVRREADRNTWTLIPLVSMVRAV